MTNAGSISWAARRLPVRATYSGKSSGVQMVLEPTIARYGTVRPSFLYSFARTPDNLARWPLSGSAGRSSEELAQERRMSSF